MLGPRWVTAGEVPGSESRRNKGLRCLVLGVSRRSRQMQHTIHAEGFGVRFRPVRMEDASFIVMLRNSKHARGNIGDSAGDVASQESWLKTYFQRVDDYYFIIETPAGIPVGTYGIYHIAGVTAEQGRFVIRPEVRAAAPSAVVSMDLAFRELGFRELRGSTVATNLTALSFYRRMGFREKRTELAARMIAGKRIDLIHFVVSAEDWSNARPGIVPIAHLAEVQIREWEREQFQHSVASA